MDDYFKVKVHHGGRFLKRKKQKLEYEGLNSEWNCDPDRWSYFDVLGNLKEMGYLVVDSMWYKIGGKDLGVGLKKLIDDKGASEMAKVGKCFGKVDLFVLHHDSQPKMSSEATIIEDVAEEVIEAATTTTQPVVTTTQPATTTSAQLVVATTQPVERPSTQPTVARSVLPVAATTHPFGATQPPTVRRQKLPIRRAQK